MTRTLKDGLDFDVRVTFSGGRSSVSKGMEVAKQRMTYLGPLWLKDKVHEGKGWEWGHKSIRPRSWRILNASLRSWEFS